MSFSLKNAPSEFQNIMNDNYNPFTKFILVYINYIIVFSKNINQHFRHLNIFLNVTQRNGLAISQKKMSWSLFFKELFLPLKE